MKRNIKINKKSLLIILTALVFSLLANAQVYALSAKQNNIYNNGIYAYDDLVCTTATDPNSSSETVNSTGANDKIVYMFFVGKGYRPFQAAAIVGNMTVESGVQPQRLQGTPSGTITKAEDWSNINGGGWGLVQWTPGSKFINAAKAQNKDPNNILVQVEFLYNQLEGTGPLSEKAAGDQFKATTNLEDAVLAFQGNRSVGGEYIGYERPADQSGSVPERTAAARAVLRKYGNTTAPTSLVAESISGVTSGDSAVNCTCDESRASGVSGNGKVVVLDPGHSGTEIIETDSASGIRAKDYYNARETENMWKVSEIITTKLEAQGFTVVNTKTEARDTVGLIKRAQIANQANATIGVSLHNTPGTFGSSSSGWVTPQEVGLYRKTGSRTKTFDNVDVANLSKQYANKIMEARKQSEGDVQIHRLDFSNRDLPATGNISITQLFSNVPWVYNEVGQTGFNVNKYAEGIANGIIGALGTEPASNDPQNESGLARTPGCAGSGDSLATGDLASTVKALAWPEYHAPQFVDRMPEYARAVQQAKRNGEYIGGSVAGVEGIDCGGFVTRLMLVSGFEPKYNYSGKVSGGAGNTIQQQKWLNDNWELIHPTSSRDLMPGDVAINSTHTYAFVGTISGFNSTIASASYSTSGNGRAPMAGKETPASSNFSWYRKK